MFHPGLSSHHKSIPTPDGNAFAPHKNILKNKLQPRNRRQHPKVVSNIYTEASQFLKPKDVCKADSRSTIEEFILAEDNSVPPKRSRTSVTPAAQELHTSSALVTELAPTPETCTHHLNGTTTLIPAPLPHHHINVTTNGNGNGSHHQHANGRAFLNTDSITVERLPAWHSTTAEPQPSPVEHASTNDVASNDAAAARFIPDASTSGRTEPSYHHHHHHHRLKVNGHAHPTRSRAHSSSIVLAEDILGELPVLPHPIDWVERDLELASPSTTPEPPSVKSHKASSSVAGYPQQQQQQHLAQHNLERQRKQQLQEEQEQPPPPLQQQRQLPNRLHNLSVDGSGISADPTGRLGPPPQTYSILLPPTTAVSVQSQLEQVLALDPATSAAMDAFPSLLRLLQERRIHPWDTQRASHWLARHSHFCSSHPDLFSARRGCLLAQALALSGIGDVDVLRAIEHSTGACMPQHTMKMLCVLVLAFDSLGHVPERQWQAAMLTALYLVLRLMQPHTLGPVMQALARWGVQPDEAWLLELVVVSKDKLVKMPPSGCLQLLSALTCWGARVDEQWMQMFVHHTKDKLYGLSGEELVHMVELVVRHRAKVPDKWYRCYQKYAMLQHRTWRGQDCARVLTAMTSIHLPVRIKLLVDLLQRATDYCASLTLDEQVQVSYSAMALGVNTEHFNRTVGIQHTLQHGVEQLSASSIAQAIVLVDELGYVMPSTWYKAYLRCAAGQLKHMNGQQLALLAHRLVKLKVTCPVKWKRLFVTHLSSRVGDMAPQELCLAVGAMAGFLGSEHSQEVEQFSDAVLQAVRGFSPAASTLVLRALDSRSVKGSPAWLNALTGQVKAAFVEQHRGRSSRWQL